jgi:2'-5' RNA ligase
MSGRGRWVDPYAGMPGRRLFVAVPLPGDAAAAVSAIVDEVRGQALPEGLHDVRWVRLDGLHLTLRFLGPTAPDRIEPTVQAVRAAAAQSAPLQLTIAGAGTFPPGSRPRTLWLGLDPGIDALASLAAAVDRALRDAGWSFDERPLRPHLTLARCDGLAAGPIVAARLAAAMADRVIHAPIDRVGVFESITGGGPARYVPIDEAPLGATPSEASAVYHRT